MHIGFFHIYPSSRLYERLAERLVARGAVSRCTAVLYEHAGVLAARREPSPAVTYVDLPRFVADRWHEWDISDENLAAIEARYGIPHLWHLVYADRIIGHWSAEDCRRAVVAYAAFWEDYLERHRPDLFVCGGVAHLPTWLGHRVFARHGVPFLTLGQSKVKSRFYLSEQVPTHAVDGLEEEVARLRREGVPPVAREEARAFLQAFRTRPTAPMAESAAFKRFQEAPSVLRPGRWLGTARRMWAERRSEDYRASVRCGSTWPTSALVRRAVTRAARWRAYRALRLFEDVPARPERYAYYGLHYQPEATTLVNGQYWTNQVALIENIARALPLTHRLYVKEHKVNLGSRPLRDLLAIRRIPNVRLISPFADTHALTRGADVVFTISGTVGWEAVLYDRPLVIFGDIFYQAYDRAVTVKEPESLAEVVAALLRDHRPDEEALETFIAAVLARTHPGFMWHGEERSYGEENLDAVAAVLERRVARAAGAAVPAGSGVPG